MTNLLERGVKGVGWMGVSTFLTRGIKLSTSFILMRLIAPKYFGIFALAVFFQGLLSRIGGLTATGSLIHRKDRIEEAISVHFFLTVLFGSSTFLVGFLISYLLRGIYDHLMLDVLVIILFFSMIRTIGKTPKGLLRKKMDFRPIAISTIIARIVASAISIMLAYYGANIWSLVAQVGANLSLTTFLYWLFASNTPIPTFDKEMVQWFLKYNGQIFIANQFSFITFQFGIFLLGTYINSTVLGYYSKALTFANLSIVLFTQVVNRVAIPAYSKLQNTRGRLSKAFNFSISAVSRLGWPLAVSLFLAAPQIIAFLWGNQWMPMVPYFRLLILYSLSRPVVSLSTSLFTAIGEPKTNVKIQAFQSMLMITLSTVLLKFIGVFGVPLSNGLIALAGSLLVLFYFLPRYIDISFRKAFFPPVLATISGLLLFFLLRGLIPSVSLLFEIFLDFSIFNGVFFTTLLVIEKRRVSEIIRKIYEAFF